MTRRWLSLKEATHYSRIGKDRLKALARQGIVKGAPDPDNRRGDWIFDLHSLDSYREAQVSTSDARLHDLRHSCATYLLKSGVPMEYVQKILGHASIKTTQIYAEVLQEVMQKEMEKLRFE